MSWSWLACMLLFQPIGSGVCKLQKNSFFRCCWCGLVTSVLFCRILQRYSFCPSAIPVLTFTSSPFLNFRVDKRVNFGCGFCFKNWFSKVFLRFKWLYPLLFAAHFLYEKNFFLCLPFISVCPRCPSHQSPYGNARTGTEGFSSPSRREDSSYLHQETIPTALSSYLTEHRDLGGLGDHFAWLQLSGTPISTVRPVPSPSQVHYKLMEWTKLCELERKQEKCGIKTVRIWKKFIHIFDNSKELFFGNNPRKRTDE